VEVTGIFKAHGVRLNSYKRTMKSVFRTYMDVVCFIISSKDRIKVHDEDFMTSANNQMTEEEGKVIFSEEQKQKFEEFASQ
jgi:DNA replication licensing factor MCM4